MLRRPVLSDDDAQITKNHQYDKYGDENSQVARHQWTGGAFPAWDGTGMELAVGAFLPTVVSNNSTDESLK
jgi:hypothetical protein